MFGNFFLLLFFRMDFFSCTQSVDILCLFLLSIKNFLFIRENWRSFATHLYETNFFTRRLYSLNTHIFWDFFCYFLDAFSFAVSCFTHFSNFFVLKEWDTERERSKQKRMMEIYSLSNRHHRRRGFSQHEIQPIARFINKYLFSFSTYSMPPIYL